MQIRKSCPQLSWSKVNIFLQCPRCFYKEVALGMKRPGIDPDSFSLNNAVDALWKKEFDVYRAQQTPHPLMIANQIDAVPLSYDLLYQWRNYKAGGIRFTDRINTLELIGVIDDIWINPNHELIIVDYKATVKHKQPMKNDARNKWEISNRQQMAFYATLFKMNGYVVHDTGYFVYSNANKNKSLFNQQLEFETTVQPCVIDNSWIEPTMQNIRICLNLDVVPEPTENCEFCKFEFNSKKHRS